MPSILERGSRQRAMLGPYLDMLFAPISGFCLFSSDLSWLSAAHVAHLTFIGSECLEPGKSRTRAALVAEPGLERRNKITCKLRRKLAHTARSPWCSKSGKRVDPQRTKPVVFQRSK